MYYGFGAEPRVQQDRVVVGNTSLAFSASLRGSMERLPLPSCSVAGPVDYPAFLRGDINDCRAHELDVTDVVQFIHLPFGGGASIFECEVALDVMTLAQRVFRSMTYENYDPFSMPPPVVLDGCGIPSDITCNEGERC